MMTEMMGNCDKRTEWGCWSGEVNRDEEEMGEESE